MPQWLEFWRVYGASDAAQSLVAKYLENRKDQRRDGARLFDAARTLLRGEEKSEGYVKLEDLLRVAPCTYEAYYAQSWLAERK